MAETPNTTSRRTMIAGGIAFSAAAIATPVRAGAVDADAMLKRRCGEHRDAFRRYQEADDRSREAHAEFTRLRPEIPDVLFWHEKDAALGLSEPGALHGGRPYFRRRDLAEIEGLDGVLSTFAASQETGALVIAESRTPAPDGWQARRDALASEIRAYEARSDAAMSASGLDAFEARELTILGEVDELTQALAGIPAKTGAGLAEKAGRALSMLAFGSNLDEGTETFALWRSVIEDAAAIGVGVDFHPASA